MLPRSIKPPLSINIFWNKDNKTLQGFADKLYSFFLRHPENPLDRYLNIPVYLYPYVPRIEALQLERTKCSANVFLIDDEMVNSAFWCNFIEALNQHLFTKEKSHRIFPVATSEFAFNASKSIAEINFIRLFQEQENRQGTYLLINLANEIYRLLSGKIRNARHIVSSEPPAIQLFLSHAEKNKNTIAKQLKNHIDRIPGLESFMNAWDLGNSTSFQEQLESKIIQSLLIVIHTDDYSSRERCRREVLVAKKNNCPVIVVNQFTNGELRSFPYIGNVRHFSFITSDEKNKQFSLDLIILEAIREALKIRYNELNIKYLSTVFNKKIDTILAYPPELLTLTTLIEKQNETILYPDPPLGVAELSLLNKIRPDLDFITPTLLPLLADSGSNVQKLEGLKIAISLSESEHLTNTYQSQALENWMVELSKYLLVSGAQLIYSGDINYQEKEDYKFNFARLLIDLIKTYRSSFDGHYTETLKPLVNYSFYPLYDTLNPKQKAALKKLVDFIRVPPPDYLGVKEQDAADIKQFDSFDKKYVWAKSLSAMRNKMISDSNALIASGGKFLDFKGKLPGVLEEVMIAIQYQKPIYLIGAFGGIAKSVTEALQGKQPYALKSAFYKEKDEVYLYFSKKFNEHSLTKEEEKIDLEFITKTLNTTGQSDQNYGLHNGLSKAENDCLFHTKNEVEIISLILKGLKNCTYEKS